MLVSMTDKGQCQFAMMPESPIPRCQKTATRKWGDHWFCDEHGTRDIADSATGIEAKVCEDIIKRQKIGIKKYGMTVAENNLTLLQWHRHQYEEMLDACVYQRKIIDMLESQQ